jgi:protoheme IX farnesyltransferase
VSHDSLTLGAPRRADVRAVEARAADYVALLKPRVMSLVVFTGLVGLVLAPGQLHPVLALTAMLCIAVGAGAAAAINMWYDADIDARMTRTRMRPIPAGRIGRDDALGFGATLAVGSVLVMGLIVNWLAATLLALTIGFYVFVYTMGLKRRTPENIVIGGAAGAFPPVIGWAAVSGEVSLAPLVLFAIILVWTPPHFWALALYRSDDYARAGVPMLPVVAGKRETERRILLYSIALAPLSLLPAVIGLAGAFYAASAGALSALLVLAAYSVRRQRSESAARRLFAFSILYLFLIFATLLAERALGLVA